MTISDRDRRALYLLGTALIGALAYYLLSGGAAAPASEAALPTPQAEQLLRRERALAASLPARQKVLRDLEQQVTRREAGLLKADTAQQAQAQLLQMITRLGRAESMQFSNSEIGPVETLGDRYGEVQVSVTTNCDITQLLNLMAHLTAQDEIVATRELRVSAGNPQDKRLNVRLTVSGLVARKLVPDRKGPVSF